MKKEADVKSKVKQILSTFGDKVWWFMPVPTGYGVQGVPDFVCSVGGQFIGIETKFGDNGLSRWQVHQMEAIIKSGGSFLVINEKNVGELHAVIEGIFALEEKVPC